MSAPYNMYSKLGFGMYKGYVLGIVFAFDPAYIQWCINALDHFCIENLDNLEDIGVLNKELDWQYRQIGDPSIIPYIDVFDDLDDLVAQVKLTKGAFKFSEGTKKRNNDKLSEFEEDYDEEEEEDYDDDDDNLDYDEYDQWESSGDDYEDDDCCPACFEQNPCYCNYYIERNS